MTETPILDERAVSEIEARANAATPLPDDGSTVRTIYDHGGGRMYVQDNGERDLILDSYNQGDSDFYFHALEYVNALCCTVKHLRERVQLLESQWCECGHTKDKHGFFSDHDECYECDQASPDLCCEWRPVARPDTQLEHLQSQLEQLRAENERLSETIIKQADYRQEILKQSDFRTRAIQLCKDKATEWHAQYDVDVTGDHDDKVYYARAATELATELEKL